MILPQPLHTGSKIALVSPAGFMDPQWVEQAAKVLRSWGLVPVIAPHALDKLGRFAGSDANRILDLQTAFDDPSIEAILCCRGGYGLARIIDKIDFTALIARPKWLIGFSDITVLHNALSRKGVASIHGIMCKHIAQGVPSLESLRQILWGELPVYHTPAHELNKLGVRKGILTGGNLSVLYGLRNTPFDLLTENRILLIEDLCEPAYHIDRMLQNLRLSGVLHQICGLIVGQFSEIPADDSFAGGVYDIIYQAVKNENIPVCFGFQAGHVENNYPLVLGQTTQLVVEADGVTINQAL